MKSSWILLQADVYNKTRRKSQRMTAVRNISKECVAHSASCCVSSLAFAPHVDIQGFFLYCILTGFFLTMLRIKRNSPGGLTSMHDSSIFKHLHGYNCIIYGLSQQR